MKKNLNFNILYSSVSHLIVGFIAASNPNLHINHFPSQSKHQLYLRLLIIICNPNREMCETFILHVVKTQQRNTSTFISQSSPPPQVTDLERNSALTNLVSRLQKRVFLYQVLEYNDSYVIPYRPRFSDGLNTFLMSPFV